MLSSISIFPLCAPCSATLSTPSCPLPGGSSEYLWLPVQHERSEKFKPLSARFLFRSGQKWAHHLDRTVTSLNKENKTGVNHPCHSRFQRSHEFLSQWTDYSEQLVSKPTQRSVGIPHWIVIVPNVYSIHQIKWNQMKSNQIIKQSINRWIDQSINQAINQINQSINQSNKQKLNQSIYVHVYTYVDIHM